MSLSKAQERRWERAILRREMKAGRLTLEQIFKEAPDYVVEMPLISVLEMVPYVGYVRIAELNWLAMKKGVNICLPVGALTPRAKQFVIEWERERKVKNETV